VSLFVRFSISVFFVGIGHVNGCLCMNGVLCSFFCFVVRAFGRTSCGCNVLLLLGWACKFACWRCFCGRFGLCGVFGRCVDCL